MLALDINVWESLSFCEEYIPFFFFLGRDFPSSFLILDDYDYGDESVSRAKTEENRVDSNNDQMT